ncbi:serine/threonine-protein kinase [Rhodopirellula europaea]|uniref:Serine/threonine-protein kinase n=1 Tax=Rhodopirellula europaea 6C TaxID=1263867 RepID=M2APF4_9BACT|nr:serine/threonine-protein kinase [Rhodopirellula europaea]EMB18955.1 serine/threonine-protein kinase [Rhodopirellula europaea 6C]
MNDPDASNPESTGRFGVAASESDGLDNNTQPSNSRGDDSWSDPGSRNSGSSRKSRSRSRRRRKGNASASHPIHEETIGANSTDQSRSSAKMPRPKESINDPADRYECLEEVGRGGWGVVEKAVDRQLDREVAVKRFCDANDVTEQERQRFLHEAKVTSQLQHPGIVPVHEMGDRRDAFYVMKLLDGVTFSQSIQDHHRKHKSAGRKTRFQFGESLEPLLQRFVDICNAVAYAHQRGVIHRDLKPSNVMISGFGETVVLDWGLAQSVDQNEHPEVDQTQETLRPRPADVSSLFEPDGTVVGTPAYMSPEQARGEVSRINRSSDLYSLGVILYTIVAGRNPYHGQPVKRILEQVRKASCPDLRLSQSLVPLPLLSIVRKAMSSSQHDRYENAEDLANDVRRFIAGDSVSVYRENWIDKGVRWCRHHQSIAATVSLAGTGLLLAAILFGVFIHRAHRAERLARIEAQQAHREAILNLSEALDATDTWLIELSGSLQFYPGMAPLRSNLLDRAIDQYDQIANQNIASRNQTPTDQVFDDFDLAESSRQTKRLALLQRIKTHLRLGDLHRITNDLDQAKQQYATAEKLLQRVAVDTDELQVTLASSSRADNSFATQLKIESIYSLIGQVLINDTSPLSDATKQRVVTARRWLAQRLPQSSDLLDAQSHNSLPHTIGQIASTAVRLELATHALRGPSASTLWDESSYLRAIETARWLTQRRGTLSDRRLSENIQTDNCRRLTNSGSHRLAEAAWTQLIVDLQQWLSSEPDRIDYMQSCAHALLQRGNCRVHLGHQADAVEDFRASIQTLDNAWRLTDDDGFYRVNLATAENNLGQLLTRGSERDPELAGKLLRQSLQTYEALLREEVTADLLRRYAQTHHALAVLAVESNMIEQGDLAEGLDHAKQSKAAFDILKDYEPLTVDETLSCMQLSLMLAAKPNSTDSDHSAQPHISDFHTHLQSLSMETLNDEQRQRANQLQNDLASLMQETATTDLIGTIDNTVSVDTDSEGSE